MRVVIQRVQSAEVSVNGEKYAEIQFGMLVLVGIESNDSADDIDWLSKKIVNLRIFSDGEGKMNRSILETNGQIMVVSQFTLFASTKKGNRPSYIRSAKPEISIPLYDQFVFAMERLVNKPVKTGVFGANMAVQLVNDGPVTILIDSKNRE
tara:strand:- start:402 stop:854 length:453 start_codon:yes stop_codon:yes gene_type:complete